MREPLTISGMLTISTDPETLNKTFALSQAHEAHVQLVPLEPEGMGMRVLDVYAGEEDRFLQFLIEVGKAAPGKVLGELEVWWPGARESGPQWWELDESGAVVITEGEVVRGESHVYTGGSDG